MPRVILLIMCMFSISLNFGCASGGNLFFDSALNDKNRAPASLSIPTNFENKDEDKSKPVNSQAEAYYLYLQSEMESNAGHGTQCIELLKSALSYDSESSTLQQRLAIELYKQGKLKEAYHWAEKARSQEPKRRDLNLLSAGLLTSMKDYNKATEIYRDLCKKDKEDHEALLYLGAAYTEDKNFSKAAEVFKKLVQSPSQVSKHMAHYYLARIYSEQKKKSSVVKKELQLAIVEKPDFFEAISMLGHLIQNSDGVEKAYKFYADHQKKHGPNSKLAELLAQYYISKNQFDFAYEQLEILDEAIDDSVQVKLKMALILIDRKIFDKAIAKLEEILSFAPESDKVRFYLAAVFEEQKDFKKALEQYEKIENASSYFEDARIHGAFISRMYGDSEKAVRFLQESIDKRVENPQSYFLMSQLLEDKKAYSKAVVYLQKAAEKFPKNALAFYNLAVLQDKMGIKEEMVANMKKVLELDPMNPQAMNYLAYSWAEKGVELDLAESYARMALGKEKDDAFIMDTLGWVLFKKGKHKEALEVLEKARKLQPQVSIIAEHLADVYAVLEKGAEACLHLKFALDFETDGSRKKELQEKLVNYESKFKRARIPSSIEGENQTN